MSYIEANRDAVEAEYQFVLKQAEETRQYWEEQNRELFAKIADQPPKPGGGLGKTESPESQWIA